MREVAGLHRVDLFHHAKHVLSGQESILMDILYTVWSTKLFGKLACSLDIFILDTWYEFKMTCQPAQPVEIHRPIQSFSRLDSNV